MCFPHCTDEKSEVQRGQVTCFKPHQHSGSGGMCAQVSMMPRLCALSFLRASVAAQLLDSQHPRAGRVLF